ncbi:MAG: transposase [Chlorobi bacterium]|nr:transposase [Chlorobiota bacterium]
MITCFFTRFPAALYQNFVVWRRGERGRLTRSKGLNLVERLEKHQAGVLAFAEHDVVPFTNNLAEQDIRPVKIKVKVAGCFRTILGGAHYARINSFFSTVRKQKFNPFTELLKAFNDIISDYRLGST